MGKKKRGTARYKRRVLRSNRLSGVEGDAFIEPFGIKITIDYRPNNTEKCLIL